MPLTKKDITQINPDRNTVSNGIKEVHYEHNTTGAGRHFVYRDEFEEVIRHLALVEKKSA